MENFERYAVYYAPPAGAFADFTARWLGWDAQTGREVAFADVQGLPVPVAEITATPRKYGFHGTLKPPFRLAQGSSATALAGDLAALAARLAPVSCEGLALHRLGGFLALTPTGDTTALAALASKVVQDLDAHRRPAPPDELARRRAAGLTPSEKNNLMRWGYPYVFDDFKFHLTLSGRLDPAVADTVADCLAPHLTPLLPSPFVLSDLALFGEDDAGRFHLIHRETLSG